MGYLQQEQMKTSFCSEARNGRLCHQTIAKNAARVYSRTG